MSLMRLMVTRRSLPNGMVATLLLFMQPALRKLETTMLLTWWFVVVRRFLTAPSMGRLTLFRWAVLNLLQLTVPANACGCTDWCAAGVLPKMARFICAAPLAKLRTLNRLRNIIPLSKLCTMSIHPLSWEVRRRSRAFYPSAHPIRQPLSTAIVTTVNTTTART